MDTKTYFSLAEAYTAVHDEELREDLYEEYDYIDDLHDEELEEIVEEVVYDLLDEGYDFEDVEDLLKEELIGEILSEARVDMKARAARRKAADTASEKAAKEAQKRGQAVARREKRAERVARVKGAIKGGMEKAKSAVKAGVAKAKEAGREAKFQTVDKRVAKYATGRKLHPAAGMAARSKDPEKRRALRKKVAGDIASRAQVAAYRKGKEVAQSASDTARKVKQSAKNLAARAGRAVSGAKAAVKGGIKGAIRKAAEKVASGATKVAKRMSEEFDQYDLVLEFLVDNEIAEDLQEAQWIMVNELNSEDIETILEAYGEPMTKRQEYLTKKVAKMNKEKAGSAHTSIKGKQNPGAALNQANKSAMQMRGL